MQQPPFLPVPRVPAGYYMKLPFPEPRHSTRASNNDVCPACRRETQLSFHHLIPRKAHRRRFFRKHYSRAQLALGIYVCRLCHDGIHDRFDEMTIAKQLSDPGTLLREPKLQTHFAWVARQKQA